MPIISDSNFCIDRRYLDFTLISKPDYVREIGQPTNENHPSGNQKYLYICVAKVASSSITQALNQRASPEPKFHHMGMRELQSLMPFVDTSQYFKFAFVRNPWDRLTSLYRDFKTLRMICASDLRYSGLVIIKDSIYSKSKNFEDFCFRFADSEFWRKEPHHKPQYDYLYVDDKLGVDFVGRFENLNEDWAQVCGKIGLNIKLTPNRVTAKDNDYREWYTPETKRCIGEVYKKDIEAFGYEF